MRCHARLVHRRGEHVLHADAQKGGDAHHGWHLADGIGMGKTSTMLHMLMHGKKCVTAETDDAPYTSKGNLIIVPINLPSQWLTELDTFCGDNMKVVTLLQSKHLKQVTMTDILRADIVISTLSFLRHSQPYNDMIESTVLQHDALRMRIENCAARSQRFNRGAAERAPAYRLCKRYIGNGWSSTSFTNRKQRTLSLRQLKCDAFWASPRRSASSWNDVTFSIFWSNAPATRERGFAHSFDLHTQHAHAASVQT